MSLLGTSDLVGNAEPGLMLVYTHIKDIPRSIVFWFLVHFFSLTHLCRVDCYTYFDKSISYIRGVWLVLLLPCVVEIYVSNANSVDLDQMPPSAASHLGLQFANAPFMGCQA